MAGFLCGVFFPAAALDFFVLFFFFFWLFFSWQRLSLWPVSPHCKLKWSYSASGLTLLLHYISSSDCTVAFCPRLVCCQEVVVWGRCLPRTVTWPQKRAGTSTFQEIHKKERRCRGRGRCYQHFFVGREKPAGFSWLYLMDGGLSFQRCCNNLGKGESSRQDGPAALMHRFNSSCIIHWFRKMCIKMSRHSWKCQLSGQWQQKLTSALLPTQTAIHSVFSYFCSFLCVCDFFFNKIPTLYIYFLFACIVASCESW